MPDILHIGQCQVVNQYIYLGALISNEGGCSQEIVRPIRSTNMVDRRV